MNFWLKVLINAAIISSANGLMKFSPKASAVLIALPTSSLIYLFWLWGETKNPTLIATASMDIFKIVIPSLIFFPVLSISLMKGGYSFPLSLFIASISAVFWYLGQRLLGWG
jgi:hypothetical protein